MTIGHLLTFIIIAALIISVGAAIVGFMLMARIKAMQKELAELRLEQQRLRPATRNSV